MVLSSIFFIGVFLIGFTDSLQYKTLPIKKNNMSNLITNTTTLNSIMTHELNIINLKKGQEYVIALEIGKGGYEWHADPDYNKTVLAISEIYESPLTKIPGTSAKVVFTIKALELGSSNFELIQKRNWENNILQIIYYKINVI